MSGTRMIRSTVPRNRAGNDALASTSISDRLRLGAQDIGRLRIPELVLGALLIVQISVAGLPLGLNEVVSVLLILLAVARRGTPGLRLPEWLMPLLILGLFYVALVSLFNDPSEDAFDWRRRLIRLVLTVTLMLVVASGRLEIRSLLVGIGFGIAVNAVLFYVGLAPDTYGGVLSGYFGDKNVAGMAIAVYGVLILGAVHSVSGRIAVAASAGLLVSLTGSRTSIAAFGLAVAWMLMAPRLPLLGKWVFGALIAVAAFAAAEDFSQIGRFSNREGSDLLRSRIDAATRVKVDDTGFFGTGLGEAYVRVADDLWLFHNSFWTLLVEGGWPWLLCILAIMALAALRPFYRGKLSRMELAGQAAGIALLLCAWRLGEVLLTQEWAIAMGVALFAGALVRHDSKVAETDGLATATDSPRPSRPHSAVPSDVPRETSWR